MADTRQHPDVDPGGHRPRNAFDHDGGYSGQEYSEEREAVENRAHAERPGKPTDDPATVPPEAGQRAFVSGGEVHGSGTGIGGGVPDEDYDDRAGGSEEAAR